MCFGDYLPWDKLLWHSCQSFWRLAHVFTHRPKKPVFFVHRKDSYCPIDLLIISLVITCSWFLHKIYRVAFCKTFLLISNHAYLMPMHVYWTEVHSLIKHVCSSHLSVKRSDMRCAHCLGGWSRHLAQAQSSNRKSWLIVFWDRQQLPYAAIIHGAALLDNTGLLLLHILFVCLFVIYSLLFLLCFCSPGSPHVVAPDSRDH